MSGVIKIDSLPKPHGEHILVKREEPEEETRDSGIIIPYQHRKLSQLGDVISLGSHSRTTKKGKRIPFDVKIGDQILFKWHAATTVLEFDDIQYLLLKEDDITYVEKEFNEILLKDGYVSLFSFPKLKEFVKLIVSEKN